MCLLAALAVLAWPASTPRLSAGQPAAKPSLQPDAWDAGLSLPQVRDLSPDPRILEVAIEARVAEVEIEPGLRVDAWTYNGGLPGPLLRLRVGDRLIVHFTNHLPAPTTIHWHGVRVPIEMDGVPGVSQPDVKPGESFTYDFTVPDAGLFWYHPHVMSAMQVGNGLYGPLLVDDPADSLGVADELVLVLSDIEIDDRGRLAPHDTGGSVGMVFGREGNHVLVNGRKLPALHVRSGAPQRWRVVNTAKSRYFEMDLGEGNRFTKIGSDGGLQEYVTEHDALLLAPGERADAIVTPRADSGSEIVVFSRLFNRGYGSVEFRGPDDLFRLAFTSDPPHPGMPAPPRISRTIEPLSGAGATPVRLELSVVQEPRGGAFTYHINGAPYWKAASIPATPGETQLWTVTNTTPWSHPMHLHGFFFQVLDDQGAPVRPLEWKDTVSVPFQGTLRLLVRFDDREGNWMVHCHILDHAEGGLMTTVRLGDAPPHHPHPTP